jgi:hypothetical protein
LKSRSIFGRSKSSKEICRAVLWRQRTAESDLPKHSFQRNQRSSRPHETQASCRYFDRTWLHRYTSEKRS